MHQDESKRKTKLPVYADMAFVKDDPSKKLRGELHDEIASLAAPARSKYAGRIVVYLFKLGYIYDLDLQKVAKLVNASPTIINIVIGDPIRNIGNPDVGEVAYSDVHLSQLIPSVEGCLRIGVLAAPIEGNFFSRSLDENSVVLSLFQSDELCQKAGKTREAYIAQGIVTRILSTEYRRRFPEGQLYHKETRGCIFDFCLQKKDKVQKLRFGTIDPICRGKLAAANTPERLILAVEAILARIRKPTFFDVLESSLNRPLFSFVLGGLLFGLIINVGSSLLLGEFNSLADYLLAALLVAAAMALIVINYLWTVSTAHKRALDP